MDHANDILDAFRDTRVLVLGDVMVDAYLWGRVDRISPEAPVPVVHVTQRSARLGGAANVALNLRALGAVPIVVSMTGEDGDGAQLEELFRNAGLSTSGLIRSKGRRTTVKSRVISGHQHIVRVDEENENELNAAEEDSLIERIRTLISSEKPAVVLFEDYDKGVLTERVITETIALAKASGIPTAVDPKKKNFFAYRGVDLFKPNLKELREGLKIELNAGDRKAVGQAVTELEKRLGNRISMITLSEHGVYIHSAGKEHFVPAHQRKIADVSGAGDTVIAVAALCLAHGLPIDALAELANLAGGLVCEEVGVVPIDPARLRAEALRPSPRP